MVSTLHSDILQIIFAYTPYSDYATLNRVCVCWRSVLQEKIDTLFWRPIYKDVFPNSVQQNHNLTTAQLQTLVKTFLQNHRGDIDYIVDYIKDDEALAQCLHTDALTLKEFKAKPAFDRCRLIWKAMFTNATPIIVNLVMGWLPNLRESLKKAKENSVFDFESFEKIEKIVSSLIEEHKVPYNKIDFICALVPVAGSYPNAMEMIVDIVKSNEDLSELDARSAEPLTDSVLGPDEHTKTMGDVVRSICAMIMTKSSAEKNAALMENLTKCGLFSRE